jgi:hypothetical protein
MSHMKKCKDIAQQAKATQNPGRQKSIPAKNNKRQRHNNSRGDSAMCGGNAASGGVSGRATTCSDGEEDISDNYYHVPEDGLCL